MKQEIINPNRHRREFLGTLAAGAAALGLSALSAPLQLDAKPLSPPSDYSELESWFDKINGKHRMVFDATHPHEIFPFAASWRLSPHPQSLSGSLVQISGQAACFQT